MASATLTQCINRIWAIANHLQDTPQQAAALELHQCLEILADVRQQQHAEEQEHHELEQALHKSLLCNRLAFSIAISRIYGQSIDRMVESVLQQIHSAFPNWRVAYSTIDAQGQLTVIQSLQPEGMLSLTGLRVDLTLAPEYLAALRRGEPVIIEDVADASSISPLAEVMLARRTQAVLDLPLKPSRQLVGLLCLDSPQPYCWNEHEIGTMIEIADYLSYALQEVHTQQERQQAEAVLYQANRELQQYATQLEAANQEVETTLEELRQGNEELMVARQEIERQWQRYQDLFNFAPDGYLVTDAWGVIQEANQAARRLLAAPRSFQILSKPLSIFIPLEERRAFRTQLSQLRTLYQPIQFEINLQPRQGRRGDGETGRRGRNFSSVPQFSSPVQARTSFFAAIAVTAIQDWQGERDRFFWLIRDISDKKRAELALQQLNQELEERVRQRTADLSEANAQLQAEITERLQLKEERSRLIAILEASADYIATATTQGDVLWHNPQLKKIRGLSLDADVTHLQIADYHPQWAFDIIQQQGIPTAIRDGVWFGETALLDENEQEIPVSQMILAHKSADGTMNYLSTVMRDISNKKRAEIVLHQREQEFRALVENSPDPVARLNRDGRILYINPAATQIMGLIPEQYIGKTSRELGMPEDCNQLWQAAVRQVFETKRDVKVEFEYPGIQGSAYFQTRYVPELNLAGEVETVLAMSRDITELKQAQAQLQETNNLLEAVIQSAPVAIDLLTPDGTVLLWNGMAQEIFGWSAEEVLGKLLPTVSNAKQPELQEFLQATFTGKAFSPVETRRQRKDGSWVDVRLSTAPVKDAQGRVIGGLGITQDITEQQAVIREREQAEQHIRFQARLLNAVEQAVIATDLQGNISYWNRFAEVLYGWKADEVLGRLILEVTPASTTQAQAADIFSHLQAGESWSGEFLVQRRDGTVFPIMIVDSPIYDDRGVLSGIVGISMDMTKLKQSEAALRESEELFRQLAENIRDIFLVYSADLKLIYVSPAYEEIWGESRDALYANSNSWLDRLHPDDRERIISILSQVNQQNLTYEYRIIRRDGQERWIRMRTFLVRDESGNLHRIVGLGEDFTERKHLELALQQSEQRFRSAFETAAVGMCLVSLEGRCLEVNRSICQLWGYSEQELRSLTVQEITYPEDMQVDLNLAQQLLTGEISYYHLEKRYLHKQGQIIWGLLSVSLIRDLQQNPLYFIAQIQDISDRKVAELALRAVSDRLQYLLTSSPAVIFSCEPEGDYKATFMSLNVSTILGYEAEEFLESSQFWASRVHPDDLERLLANFSQIFEQGSYYYEYRFLHADGTYHWLSSQLRLIQDAAGNPTEFVGYLIDINNQKRAEEKLRETQQHLQAILDYSPALIYAIDRNNNYLFINRRYKTLVSTTQESLIGKSIYDVWPTEICDAFSVNNQQILQSGEPMEFEEVVPHADGLHTYITIKFPLYDANSVAYAVGGISADITDRKQAEDAHRRSEARFRALMQTSPDIITLSTPEGGVFYQSPAVDRILGYAPEEFVGELPMQVLHPDDCENLQATITRMLANPGVPIGIEYRLRHKNGSWVWLEGIGTNLLDEPDIQAFVVFSRDIRDRKLAEEKLQASQHFIQKIADASPNLLYLYDLEEQRNIYVNREITQMLGYTPEEVQAMGKELFLILMHPDDLSVSPEKQQEIAAASDGEAIEFEYRLRHKNGEWRWLYSWDTIFARNADGKPTQILGTATDISDRKKLELALQQSEERFRTCVENLLEPLAIFSSIRDATGQIVDFLYEYINPAGCQSNQMPKEAMLGKPMCEVFPALRDIGVFEIYCGVVETGESFVADSVCLEGVFEEQQSQLFYDVQAVKLGDGFMVTWRDVTERKQADAQIQASLQEKEVLLKEIHHRVKNNLQVILSLLKLQSSYTDEARTLQMFQESQNRIRSMALIHELLYHSQDLARIDFGAYIRTLVNQLARTYTVTTGAISWEIDVEPPIVQLTIDTALPCGLMINELVSNALKYAFPAGQPGKIKLSLQACNNGELILVVSDNGVGISSDLDFRHTDSLGLQLVCGTTSQLGGTIELNRTQGTTFTIKFKEVKYKPRK